MKIVLGLLLGLLLLLQYELWFARGGVVSAWEQQNKIQAAVKLNKKLQQRNRAIAANIKDLKSGHQAIEAEARSELGMIKKGEVFYQVVP